MQKLFITILLITNLTTICFAFSKDIKFDMYKTKFIDEMKAQEYKKAIFTLNKLKKLGIRLPSSVLYFEGKAQYKVGNPVKAYKALELYLTKEGKKAKYYKESISMLIKSEDAYNNFKNTFNYYGTIYKKVTSPYTNRVWLDRNMGAKRACTSPDDSQCYGKYYTLKVASTLCPIGFSLPTQKELQAELPRQHVKNKQDAFNGFLRLSTPGYKHKGKVYTGFYSRYWTKSFGKANDGTLFPWYLSFYKNGLSWTGGRDSNPTKWSVRCIQNEVL